MTLVTLLATYTLFLVLLIAAGVWLTLDRPRKVELVVAGVLALAVVGVLIVVTSAIWTDPRPFLVDGVAPAIAHAADNGFPSDHTAAAAAVAGLVLAYRRRIGILLVLLAVVVGMSRVAAHVHHVPDIIGGLGIGLMAAAAGVTLARVAMRTWVARQSASRVS
ncbi:MULTISPECIES: phosphatase PAP2 family protein [Intrasporangiaceae]|uniref:Phosphoesterase PA-phosphatase n=1 Tax=Intrasporangium chromatireducens Q5-1 TaxID=584657 RepID=W9GLS5_9MICO|nr:phosphatase PAP2 family protein [Intrasporangium chromatireducens]EWT06047.1 phosphoesterase PA-phosphatase [Intrasporangium chromatireducens Q5-1]